MDGAADCGPAYREGDRDGRFHGVLCLDVQRVVPMERAADRNVREPQPQCATRGRRVDAAAGIVFRVFQDAGSNEATPGAGEAVRRNCSSEAELAALGCRSAPLALLLAATFDA